MIILRQRYFAVKSRERLDEIVKINMDETRKSGQKDETGEALSYDNSAEEGYTHTQCKNSLRRYHKNNPKQLKIQ